MGSHVISLFMRKWLENQRHRLLTYTVGREIIQSFAAFVEDTCSGFRAMSVISSISSVGDAFSEGWNLRVEAPLVYL